MIPLREKLNKQLLAKALSASEEAPRPRHANGYFVIQEQGTTARPAKVRSLQALTACTKVLCPIKDALGQWRNFDSDCNCTQCQNERGAYYGAELGINGNEVTIKGPVDTAASGRHGNRVQVRGTVL